MEKAATDLKWERQKRNISLEKIAADTHISLRYLQSIEEGRFSDLPGGVYSKAFIKAYCESLNLEPEELLKRYEESQPSVSPEKHSNAIIPLSEPDAFSLPTPVILWSLILLAALLGGYLGRGWIVHTFSQYFSHEKETAENLSTPPENPQAVESPITATNLQNPEPEPGTLYVPPAFEDTQPPMPGKVTVDHSSEETSSPSAPVSGDRPASDAKIRVELKALESCWIYATIDGAPGIEKLMGPGKTELFFAEQSARIKIGNAGGIQMIINDIPAKPLGGKGEVVTMNINPDNIEQFTDQE